MEYIDIVDEDNNLIGNSAPKDDMGTYGYWHRIIIAWIVNEKNEILFEKRAKQKKYYADKWAILGGHISSGETPEEGLTRELKEELGISANTDNIKLINLSKSKKKFGDKKYNRYIYEYVYRTNMKIEDFKLQEEEVSDVKYLSIDEVKNIRHNDDELTKYTADINEIERIEEYLLKNEGEI